MRRQPLPRAFDFGEKAPESADFQATYEAVFRLVLYGLRQQRLTPETVRQALLGATRKANGWFGVYAGETIAAVIQRAIADALAYQKREGS